MTVRDVAAEERDRAISVEVMAFGSDPVFRWIYREPHDYLSHFPDFARAFGGAAFEQGTAYVGGEFGGVSLWLPPGVRVDPAPVVALIEASVGDQVRAGLLAILEQMERYHIEEEHWYLPMIGVDPAHQGHGIGSALLRHTLAGCDREGLPAYLESSNPANVPLYERHGFEVLGEIRVDDSPTVFPMLRPPR